MPAGFGFIVRIVISGGRTHISPRDLAAAVDVSESSLKRWADSGRLKVVRTAGGHRRIPISEAIRFVREAGMRVVDPGRIGLPNVGPTDPGIEAPREEDLEALFRAHRGRDAATLLVRAFLGGVPVAQLCDGPIRGALQRIGRLYETDDEGIAIEHGAVDACIQGLNTIRQTLAPGPENAPVAVGGAASGDPYILPSLSVAAVLEEVGFRAINTGPHTPLEALRGTVRREGAAIVWRSYSIRPSARELANERALLAELEAENGCEIVLGGRYARLLSGQEGGRIQSFGTLLELSGFARAALDRTTRLVANG